MPLAASGCCLRRSRELLFERLYAHNAPMGTSPGAEQVEAPAKTELRPELGRYRPCFKLVLITIAGRDRFGILRAWLQVGHDWLCQVEYMNDEAGSTEGWYRFDPDLIQPTNVTW